MDFSTPEIIEDVLPEVRELIEREVIPLEPGALVEAVLASSSRRSIEVRQKVKQMGLWAPHVPRDHGGMGLNCVEYALVGEELGRSPLGHYVFNAQAPDAGNMEILREFGTPAQRERWLAPLWSEARSAVASP